MFYRFENQEMRRNFGGSAFIEIQYCKLKPETKTKKIVSINSVKDWQDDSLYIFVEDIDEFISNYEDIFNGGVYNNLKVGPMDIFGINYYSPNQLREILKKIENKKPNDYMILVDWLKQDFEYNGFYILGI